MSLSVRSLLLFNLILRYSVHARPGIQARRGEAGRGSQLSVKIEFSAGCVSDTRALLSASQLFGLHVLQVRTVSQA